MSRRRRRGRGGQVPILPFLCAGGIIFAAFLVVVLLNDAMGGQLPLPTAAQIESAAADALDKLYGAADLVPQPVHVDGEVSVHFIDVGQADCELIQTPESTVLIDAGDIGGGDAVVAYLKAQGVNRIDLLIASHPHADHIGGMKEVVETFDIGKIIFSDVPDELIPTSKTYEGLIDAIAARGYKITKAEPRAVYDLGGGASLTILGPVAQYDDLNETSVACRFDFGKTSFLFTGDAERENENDLVAAYGSALKADVFKLGHHGSSTSNQQKLLNAVDPDIAVCEVGYDNSYGHPHAETLERLLKMGVMLYRTDRDGTVVISSDGETLSVVTEK